MYPFFFNFSESFKLNRDKDSCGQTQLVSDWKVVFVFWKSLDRPDDWFLVFSSVLITKAPSTNRNSWRIWAGCLKKKGIIYIGHSKKDQGGGLGCRDIAGWLNKAFDLLICVWFLCQGLPHHRVNSLPWPELKYYVSIFLCKPCMAGGGIFYFYKCRCSLKATVCVYIYEHIVILIIHIFTVGSADSTGEK